jgi:hypothetical protein
MADIATEPKASTGNALISLLYAARALRGFGDGFAVIILPAYMTALGYDAIAVGIVATASLLGTALLTLITGWIAPRHDLRALLIFGAGLMAATGLAFPGAEHFVLIVLVAFIGTINPSGGDLGVLVPLEHAVLAKSAPHKDNALKLMEFLASDEGQQMYAEVNNEYPVKEGVPWSPLVKSWGNFKPDPISLNEIAALRKKASELVDKVGFDDGPSS